MNHLSDSKPFFPFTNCRCTVALKTTGRARRGRPAGLGALAGGAGALEQQCLLCVYLHYTMISASRCEQQRPASECETLPFRASTPLRTADKRRSRPHASSTRSASLQRLSRRRLGGIKIITSSLFSINRWMAFGEGAWEIKRCFRRRNMEFEAFSRQRNL